MDGLARLRDITNTSSIASKRGGDKSDLVVDVDHRIQAGRRGNSEDFNEIEQATLVKLMETAVGGLQNDFNQL